MYFLTRLHYCFQAKLLLLLQVLLLHHDATLLQYILEVLGLPLLHTALKQTLSTHYYFYPLLLLLHYILLLC